MPNEIIHDTVVHFLNRDFYVLKLFTCGLDDHGHFVILPDIVPLVDGCTRKYIYASDKLFFTGFLAIYFASSILTVVIYTIENMIIPS